MPLPKKIPAWLRTALSPSNGRVVGNRYSIEKKLTSGSYGTAYLVQDMKSNKKWKVLKEIVVSSLEADDMTNVEQEAKLLSKLNHPGIVRFKDSFLAGEFFCIVTEYCEGGDLRDKIKERQKEQRMFSESLVLDWFIQLMLGIQYIHEQRVLHRDLKTRNIFLKNNMIKIGDFGISRIMMGSSDLAKTLIGTPCYMSPEVMRCAGYNSKADIWSAGCILYEMCALQYAYDGAGFMGVMNAIIKGGTPKLPDEYSSSLADVLETMLRKDPAKRVSASEVLRIPYIAKHMQPYDQPVKDVHAARADKLDDATSFIELKHGETKTFPSGASVRNPDLLLTARTPTEDADERNPRRMASPL